MINTEKESKTSPEFVHKESLPNGLNVLIHEMPWAESVCVRLLIAAGPRHENLQTCGSSHYLEHMLFEGSHKYCTRRELDRAIEARGGASSAFTEKEYVMFQAKVLPEYASFTTEFLRDLVFDPLMAEETVIGEKETISEELRQSIDNPTDHVWHLLRQFIWKAHPLAFNPLGTFESIKGITKEDLVAFHQKLYRPNNGIIVITGKVSSDQGLEMAAKNFGELKTSDQKIAKTPPPIFISSKPRVLIENRKMEQVHALLSFSTEGNGENSAQLAAIRILTKILSTDVFHHLVYNLRSSYSAGSWPWLVSDNGSIVVFAAAGPEKIEKTIRAMVERVNALEITDELIAEAKAKLKADLTLHLADTDQYAHFIGEQYLFKGKVSTPAEIRAEIDNLRKETLEDLRRQIFSDKRAAMVILGPVSEQKAGTLDDDLRFIPN